MKLDKKDNVRLMHECCIVREIEYTQQGKELEAQEFKLLRKTIQNSKNLSFEDLKEAYSDSYFSIKSFINQMETYKKSTLNRTYYKKALAVAKEYYSSFENSEKEKFNNKLKDQFFNKNRINNLRIRQNRHHAKFIGGTTITALLAAGALILTHPNGDTKLEPTPTPIETHIPTNTPNPTQKPLSEIDNLDVNSTNFYDSVVQDFKTRYANSYNTSNESDLTTNDFVVMPQESQNYIWQIKVGDEYRYLSHGDLNHAQMVEQYLEENNIERKSIPDCQSVSVYSAKDGERITDSNGSYIKIDSITKFTDPKTGKLKVVELLDGNNIQQIFEQNTFDNQSSLLELSDSAFSLSYYNSNEELKKSYTEAVNHEDSKKTNNNELENQFEDEGR